MKKEEKKVAENVSSGAEKVERVEKEVKIKKAAQPSKKNVSAKGDAALGNEKKVSVKQKSKKEKKAKQESAAAKARVERALKKKEEKAKRKALQAEKRKARRAEMEKRRQELMEKRKERKAALAQKREERQRERAHSKANKRQAAEKRRKQRKEKQDNHERKGYGGWLAAVLSLSAVTLALGAAVTAGGVEMRRMDGAMTSGCRGTMYELTGIIEHMDEDLDRVRVSADPKQQSRILTDLLVQARLAEMDVEKLPLSSEEERNLTSFVNHTARVCDGMLAKLRSGEGLDERDKALLEKLYATNHSVRQELDSMLSKMQDKDLKQMMKDGKGTVRDSLKKVEDLTLPENNLGGELKPTCRMPEPKKDKGDKHISSTQAEELCKKYFNGYDVDEFYCVGETSVPQYTAYNVEGRDKNGTLLFAEISQKDGKLLRFDYYEDCNQDTLDYFSAQHVAEEFLEKLGYDDMEPVRLQENGGMVNFTFVYEDDDVVYYPDEIKVKVCRTRGIVSGMDCVKYALNHRERDEVKTGISMGEAKAKLQQGFSVQSARLTVIDTARGERAAYEFFGSYGEDKYIVYLSAQDGSEISIVNIKNL